MSSALSSIRTRRTQQQPSVTSIASGASHLHQQPQPQPHHLQQQPLQPQQQPHSSHYQQQQQPIPLPQQHPPKTYPTGGNNTGQATLQQIIEIYGKRLITLESWMQTAQKNNGVSITLPQVNELIQSKIKSVPAASIDETVKEWNARFELIAQELSDLKEVVLQLQNYTMTVNKVLLEKNNVLNDAVDSKIEYDDSHDIEYDEGEDDMLPETFEIDDECGTA